jgi:hypothetical protein
MLSVTGLGSVWILNAGSFTPKRYRVSNDFQAELAEEARAKTKSRTRSDTLVVWLHFSNG